MASKLLLGCSGSVAVLWIPNLIMELRARHGLEIQVVMTSAAQKFITPYALTVLTGNITQTEIFGDVAANHIKLIEACPLYLISPATANVISKIAVGQADDIVTLCACACIGSATKLIIAPAMNNMMWGNPIIQGNVEKLEKAGVHFVRPSQTYEIADLAQNAAVPTDDDIINKVLELAGT